MIHESLKPAKRMGLTLSKPHAAHNRKHPALRMEQDSQTFPRNASLRFRMTCPICEKSMSFFGEARLLKKHVVQYFRCAECGHMRTEEPTWLDEAYSAAIAAGDIGLVGRNVFLRDIAHALLAFCVKKNGPFLDFGGGYGLFTRLMRDRGFAFLWEDPMCPNLFARGFEANLGSRFEVLTAFEVFEHLPDPIQGLEKMLARSNCIFFSTELVPEPPPKLGDWWYYALESGQHISLYTRKSLALLARRYGLHFYTNGRTLHLFTEKSISSLRFRLACSGRLAPWIARVLKRDSLLPSDHKTVLARLT
jgi:hypothetical protein